MAKSKRFMGIDLGSVSLNVVVIDGEARIEAAIYRRTEGQPLRALVESLKALGTRFERLDGVVVTGSGRKLLGSTLKVFDINEIATQAKGAFHFHPDARTIIEIGGQDSKLIFMDHDPDTNTPLVKEHALNEVCAAGTGSFLDLQAHRLGMTIEELGTLAVRARHPARISGRCSVFAKSDMVHLLQEGASKADVVSGLCYALTRNYITNLAKGRPLTQPILFQGGVAANPGVVRAFEDLLGLDKGGLVIPEHFLVMGAIGAALTAREKPNPEGLTVDSLAAKAEDALAGADRPGTAHLRPLPSREPHAGPSDHFFEINPEDREVYLGIDVGAVSTNIVLMDRAGRLVAKRYAYTQGQPVDAVRLGLQEMGREGGNALRVLGVGVTGSGRYFIGDFVGADAVINEITAQARAAVHLEPEVDTIIEIGGQDSKYIRCEKGRVTAFEMNRACAAGTGSFLEEQAARLQVPIRDEFSRLAFASAGPADLGARCTVFMESDLIHHLQSGKNLKDLTAGLAYAIAYNYLEKVVGARPVGRHILFQGGVAANLSVAAAFENILGKPVVTPAHHNVTGALGAALAARDRQPARSRFAGFDLAHRTYDARTFECERCPNLCRIHEVCVDGEHRAFYGSLCGRYERSHRGKKRSFHPDLIEERQDRLCLGSTDRPGGSSGPGLVIGIPKTLGFFDYFPYWQAFFEGLGHNVVLSEDTNKTLVERGLAHVPSETCLPVKSVYGHIDCLVQMGVDRILLPSEIDCPQPDGRGLRSYNCPYIQAMPYMARAALGKTIKLLSPVMRRHGSRQEAKKALLALGASLGHDLRETRKAAAMAEAAQRAFDEWRRARGKALIAALGPGERAIVLLGKTHNLYDPGLNLHLGEKLRHAGLPTIPYDMLPLDEVLLPAHYDNVVWKNTRDLMKAVLYLRDDPRLFPLLITNFGCGPDSFFMKYMESELPAKPHLVLEVDEHTGDAGLVTRLEAFLDTLEAEPRPPAAPPEELNLVIRGKARTFDPWSPDRQLMKRLENRVLYFPHVSLAFCAVVRSAFRAIDLEARTLPEADEESEILGRRFTSSRECHPFVVTCGDYVKMTLQAGFDPDCTAVLMQNYDGACRFSQYAIGHADLFRRLGLPQIPVVAPLTSPRFDEFSRLFGLRFTRALWQGWVAAEVLERLRLHVRPYEKTSGETDGVFATAVERVAEAIAESGRKAQSGRPVLAALRSGVQALKGVAVDRSQPRPRVGILGEFYTVLNARTNHNLIRTLEGLGAEVMIHGLTVPNCYTLFSQRYYARNRRQQGDLPSAAYYLLRNQWVMSWVKRAERFLENGLEAFGTLRAQTIVREASPFIDVDIDPILAIFTTRVRRFAASGVSGICNLFVLNCMLGNITIPIFRSALREYGNLPILHAIYDGQQQTNMLTRVEAFMDQVKLYDSRKETT